MPDSDDERLTIRLLRKRLTAMEEVMEELQLICRRLSTSAVQHGIELQKIQHRLDVVAYQFRLLEKRLPPISETEDE